LFFIIHCPLLHLASKNGHLSVVKYLVDQGADISATDSNGRNLLDISNTKTFEFLKTIQIRNDRIFDACKAGELQTIIDIHQSGFFINTMHNGHFLMHIAAQYGHLSVVEYLVNHKADINAKTKDVMF